MGEQIDVRSGNLNYSYPLLTAISRGLSAPLSLIYNSQNWRLDENGNSWALGTDVGYGYGWQLQFGSVTPYFSSLWDIAFYEFRDPSGAVYRLDQNANGIWTSRDSSYVSFDAQAGVLHFNDGSQWDMGNISGGLEPDAGSMYPWSLQDSNGNQIIIYNDWGAGWPSSRIAEIYDARSPNGPYDQESYDFYYDSTGHLTSITNSIGSGEAFTFAFGPSETLQSPFASSAQFGHFQALASITNVATNLTTNFSWDASNDAELTQVTFPYSGYLRWEYGSIEYSQETVRAVQNRYLLWDSTIGERAFAFSRTLGSGSGLTATTTLVDAQANAGKEWDFDTAQDGTQGLVTTYKQYQASSGNVLRQVNYAWTQDSSGRNYIGRTQDITNPNTPASVTKQTDQSLDQYGNVT